MKLIEKIEGEQLKKHVPFSVGDSVKVHTRVKEGDKERTQVFAGIIIGHKGRGLNESFTVRRISYGEGVERVFPINSPRIEKIEVEREGKVRRAKLFYLRSRKGKEALFVKEKVKAAIAKKEKASARRAAKAEKEAAAAAKA
ncbi:MAG: 50S ribosomal protein L19 [Verrucomicrobiota bacterium]